MEWKQADEYHVGLKILTSQENISKYFYANFLYRSMKCWGLLKCISNVIEFIKLYEVIEVSYKPIRSWQFEYMHTSRVLLFPNHYFFANVWRNFQAQMYFFLDYTFDWTYLVTATATFNVKNIMESCRYEKQNILLLSW